MRNTLFLGKAVVIWFNYNSLTSRHFCTIQAGYSFTMAYLSSKFSNLIALVRFLKQTNLNTLAVQNYDRSIL